MTASTIENEKHAGWIHVSGTNVFVRDEGLNPRIHCEHQLSGLVEKKLDTANQGLIES